MRPRRPQGGASAGRPLEVGHGSVLEHAVFSFIITGGVSELFGARLALTGTASAKTVGRAAPGAVAASFAASFHDTLRWGGITNVTDLSTGLPVTHYTITSDSGFDYSQAAPIPEPSASLFIALGLGALATTRKSAAISRAAQAALDPAAFDRA